MSGIYERVNDALENAEYYRADPAQSAGRRAEYKTRRKLNKRISGSGWRVDSSVRVPDWRSKSRREFDFVITGIEKAIAVELKNWSGEISYKGSNIIQDRRFDKKPVNHGDIFGILEEKVDVLKKYNELKGRLTPPIEELVVFYNSKLTISEEINKKENVISYSDLLERMPDNRSDGGSSLLKVLEAIMEMFGYNSSTEESHKVDHEPSKSVDHLRKTLDEVGTWDVIDFNGSKTDFGDVLTKGNMLTVGGKNLLDRSSIKSLEFDIDRSVVSALFSDPECFVEIRLRNGNSRKIKIDCSTEIGYQSAGSPRPEYTCIRSLERIEFGYVEKPKFRIDWENLEVGAEYVGIVKNKEEYGAFIDIGAPTDGLLHVSEMGKNIDNKKLDENQMLMVNIKSINKEKREISLSATDE